MLVGTRYVLSSSPCSPSCGCNDLFYSSSDTTGGWIALTVLAILTFRRERSHEPSFLPPSSPVISQHGGGRALGYSQVNEEEKATDVSYSRPSDVERDVGLYNHSVPSSTPNRPVVQRYESRMSPVQTTGGAFPLGGAGAGEPSRTLQLAYSDPCEYIPFLSP